MQASSSPSAHGAPSRQSPVRVAVGCEDVLREPVLWALEALLVRAGVRWWEPLPADADDGDAERAPADVVYAAPDDAGSGHAAPDGAASVVAPAGDSWPLRIPHDPRQWQFVREREPDAARDPLAAAFWWLARVEERLAAEQEDPDAFDQHGRFRYAASALARRGDPLARPVDELAQRFAVLGGAPAAVAGRCSDVASWVVVATHDIDQTWRWTRAGVRRSLRVVLAAVRARRFADAARRAAALAAVPAWRLRGDDPWCNAHRIRRLEWTRSARSTSYVLVDRHVPEDGSLAMHERGRERYLRRLLDGRAPRRGAPRRGPARSAPTPSGDAGDAAFVGLHGSYTSSRVSGRLRQERELLERAVGRGVVDHRFHYLRHRPVDAWRELAAAGIASDATMGYAEQVGFRAGTAMPYRAWDHVAGRPLDLIVIPLAFMDATLDRRYLDAQPGPAADTIADSVLDAIAARNGCASILFHNDRLCTVDSRAWTRLYARMLERVRDGGGAVVTAREAASAYRSMLPAHRTADEGA